MRELTYYTCDVCDFYRVEVSAEHWFATDYVEKLFE